MVLAIINPHYITDWLYYSKNHDTGASQTITLIGCERMNVILVPFEYIQLAPQLWC